MMNYKDDIPTKQLREDLKVLMTKIVEWDLDKDGYGVASVMLASFELKGNWTTRVGIFKKTTK